MMKRTLRTLSLLGGLLVLSLAVVGCTLPTLAPSAPSTPGTGTPPTDPGFANSTWKSVGTNPSVTVTVGAKLKETTTSGTTVQYYGGSFSCSNPAVSVTGINTVPSPSGYIMVTTSTGSEKTYAVVVSSNLTVVALAGVMSPTSFNEWVAYLGSTADGTPPATPTAGNGGTYMLLTRQ